MLIVFTTLPVQAAKDTEKPSTDDTINQKVTNTIVASTQINQVIVLYTKRKTIPRK